MPEKKTVANKAKNAAAKGAKIARVVIVDSHPVAREGLAYVLRREPDLKICGQAENYDQALKLVASARPALVIMGLLLKNSQGLKLIKALHQRFPRVLILVVSMHDESTNAGLAINAGAAGYIHKEEPTTRILAAVRKVLRGEIYLSQKLSLQLVAELAGSPPLERGCILDCLSEREREVFALIGDGFGRRQIAARLHLDVNTVEAHRARIRDKLRLKDARDLLQYAIQWQRAQPREKPSSSGMVANYAAPVFSENLFRAGFL